MLDRQIEGNYYPRGTLDLGAMDSLLCVAPHPDDEVFGCGGLMVELARRGQTRIQVLILSRGECAEGDSSDQLGHIRVRESRRAAQVLGIPEPHFLEWKDRELRYCEPLIESLQRSLEDMRPSYLLAPSLSEPHPDHQAVALAATVAAQRCSWPVTLLYYEVGAPLHPNVLLDITSVADTKWAAAQVFASQNGLQPYPEHAQALARVRAFLVGPHCMAAEAYFRVEAAALRQQGLAQALPYWPRVRQELNLANKPQQLPMVSVLIRSMDRPLLAQALAAVAAQTYPHLELVIVNASGRAHGPVFDYSGRFAYQMVEPKPVPGGTQPVPCDRSQAANLALRAARGDFALFLDDDDLIDAHHVQRLVDALMTNSKAVAAYAGVRVEALAGQTIRVYDLPWSYARLRGINFLPIHAVLFRCDRVQAAQLVFDEKLPVLEDWDFWLKLARLGEFVHCPGVSAAYRQGHGDSGISDPAGANHWQRWHRVILERELAQTDSVPAVAEVLGWHAIELDKLDVQYDALQSQYGDLQTQYGDLQTQYGDLQTQCEQLQVALLHEKNMRDQNGHAFRAKTQALEATLSALHGQMSFKEAELALLYRSRSWRWTRPLRWVSQKLSRWLHGN